ncbi:hypothetical protein J1C56_02335 [Aminobacter anthyllidis]|uniref:Uncharacterized protein n=1 Tax=Aminobacter anthyllidis TaxID=1035067 RepID=A0A9X1A752_9HYPH|nr:hypothetical protein [Aminobacter anthyllidis]MBT1154423.1 hypothetical protein [Aminobacter anthyllidis]
MASVSGALANLIGGVSQQPPEIRAVNTADDLKNTWSDVAVGLGTRPCGAYAGAVSNAPAAGKTVATHNIHKPSGSYRITVHGGAIYVTDIKTGTVKPVTVEGAAGAYIATDDAQANLGFITLGDTTFVWNRSKTVTKTKVTETSALTGASLGGVTRRNPNRHGTVWVKQRAGYNANYAVYFNNVQKAIFTTGDATPSAIANDLNNDLNAAGIAGLTSTMASNSIFSIQLPAEGDYITTHDDFSNNALQFYNDFVDEFTDLPNFDALGRLVLVKQEMGNPRDDYWVWFTSGGWEETVGWNASESLNNATMPHILVDNKNGTWTFKQHSWKGREVGDDDSNPTPSFVDKTINSMFIYKGRMIVLSDENCIGSQVGTFENFYRSTCTQLLDDDPFDIASPNSSGAQVNYGVEFDNGLLLFSKYDQFKIDPDNEGTLSPNTVSIKRVNAYNAAPMVPPTYIGSNVLFVDDFDNGGFAKLREYQVERTFGRQVAPAVTDAIPEYIPSGVYSLQGSSSDDIIVLLSKGRQKSLWLYNYYFNSEGKVQSSWQEWTFPFKLWGAGFVDDHLILTAEYAGKLHLLSFNFDSGADRVLDRDSVLLDFRLNISALSPTFNGKDTTVTLPYAVQNDADLAKHLAVVAPGNTGPLLSAKTYKPTSRSGNTITFKNVDLRSNDVVIGWTFGFYWKLNPIYMRDNNLVAIQDGRLQLRGISLLYSNSGPFRALVTPESRDTFIKPYTGIIVGSGQDLLGSFKLDSGKFAIGAYGKADTVSIVIEGETPWRVRFSSLEWHGSYRPTKKRTT